YRPLDSTKSQIRLITPLFDHPHPLPRFTLEEVSLEENPSYSALSYVWGDAQIKRAILVDDRVVLVTKNLFSALINVHVPASRIWIDAICINQEDDDEKSWQVQLMREIYVQAEYTAA
ncbi:heterokaryon incompatibility protein-domain-containing protein, partial [Clohesyomyces aquaticus]